MGILSRFKDIVSANINELLDKAEDPEKMAKQYLRKSMEDLAEVKKETAEVMAEEARCKRLLDSCTENVNKYDNLAKKALTAGNEGDARTFIAEKQKYDTQMASLQQNYELAHTNAEKMKQLHAKLTQDVSTLQSRLENVKATMAVAKTQNKIAKAQDAANGAAGSLEGFSRMEEKARNMLDTSAASMELSSEPADSAQALESKYSGGGSVSVDDELARMKAEMGL